MLSIMESVNWVCAESLEEQKCVSPFPWKKKKKRWKIWILKSTSLVWYDGVSAVDSPFDIKCKARRSKIKELQSTAKLHM